MVDFFGEVDLSNVVDFEGTRISTQKRSDSMELTNLPAPPFVLMNAIKQNHLFYGQEREYEKRRANLCAQNQARFQEQLLEILKNFK